MYQPLADLLRPQTLDEVYGQDHILGKDAVLRRLIDSGKIPNMVFYGPSGTGKTTVANIIAKQTNRTLYKLNATTASTADIKEIVSQLDTFLAPNGVLLYLDEIQSFNKKQQQSLLEYIENGKITLIASTTENPYFYVFNAILSRSTVFEFKQISAEAALKAVRRAVSYMEERTALKAVPETGALEYIAGACGGDLRKAMNAVEVLFSAGRPEGENLPLMLADAKAVTQKSALRADRDGDNHYDLLSALQKSIRGSDPDAACHYRLSLSGQAPGGGADAVRLPPADGDCGGGCGTGLSHDYPHCKRLRGHGPEAGHAGSPDSPGRRGGADGHLAQVQLRSHCPGHGDGGCAQRKNRGLSPAPAERPR